MPITDLPLRRRTLGRLLSHGIRTVDDLVTHSGTELLRIRSFGPVALADVTAALTDRGLALADKPDHRDPWSQLRTLRVRGGHTLTSLAHETGYSHQYLSMLERGLRKPTTTALTRIAAALSQPVTALTATNHPQWTITRSCR
ncbi:helix-turn-helix domain-containing protein [Actinokineospora sp. NBRC 105648]|uniref:helix-turn-helix domain-containing protein n=1 Tax=Actinokineospora sp. NBRC 105648 TaxID=3032206 RepID=UPI002552FFEE|nr:helix-turn-helix domain-containing protein [Actinokineospora sp. NBRC 105648]